MPGAAPALAADRDYDVVFGAIEFHQQLAISQVMVEAIFDGGGAGGETSSGGIIVDPVIPRAEELMRDAVLH